MTRRAGSLTRALTVDVVRDVAGLEPLVAEWNELASADDAQPFAFPGLAVPWWRHCGRGELRVASARTPSGDLVGVAPFHRRRLAGLDVLRPLGHGLGAVATFAEAETKADVTRVLLDGLLTDTNRTVLHATDLPLDGRLLQTARRHPDLAVHAVLHDENPVIELGEIRHVDDLLASPDRQPLRKLLARADRSLTGHSVSIDIVTGPAAVAAAFESLLPLYDAAEVDRPRLHLGRGQFGGFFVEALDALARNRHLAILTLMIDSEPAAFDIHVVSGSTAFAILGRFDPRFAEMSPGHLLLRAGVQWALEADLERIDLQLGGDRYKTLWSTTSCDTMDTVISSPKLARPARAVVSGVSSAYGARQSLASWIADRTG